MLTKGYGLSWTFARDNWRAALLASLCASLAIRADAAGSPSQPYSVNVSAGPAREALTTLSAQTELTISLATGSDDTYTRAVSGSLSAPAALSQMLSGTGLVFVFVSPTEVEVRQDLGVVRWYDIPPGPARENLHRFVKTLGWDASVDRNAAERTETSSVHGCLSPEHATDALLAGTPFSYEWMREPAVARGVDVRALILREESTSSWASLFRRKRNVVVIPEFRRGEWQCYRLCEREGDPRPAQTCVHYPEIP